MPVDDTNNTIPGLPSPSLEDDPEKRGSTDPLSHKRKRSPDDPGSSSHSKAQKQAPTPTRPDVAVGKRFNKRHQRGPNERLGVRGELNVLDAQTSSRYYAFLTERELRDGDIYYIAFECVEKDWMDQVWLELLGLFDAKVMLHFLDTRVHGQRFEKFWPSFGPPELNLFFAIYYWFLLRVIDDGQDYAPTSIFSFKVAADAPLMVDGGLEQLLETDWFVLDLATRAGTKRPDSLMVLGGEHRQSGWFYELGLDIADDTDDEQRWIRGLTRISDDSAEGGLCQGTLKLLHWPQPAPTKAILGEDDADTRESEPEPEPMEPDLLTPSSSSGSGSGSEDSSSWFEAILSPIRAAYGTLASAIEALLSTLPPPPGVLAFAGAGADFGMGLNLGDSATRPNKRNVPTGCCPQHPPGPPSPASTALAYIGSAAVNPMDAAGAGAEPPLVAYLDIGQGECTALYDTEGKAIVYFDFGAPSTAQRGTRPLLRGHDVNPCLCNGPLIILSHWDMDHCALGREYPDAYRCRWLAPQQHMGTGVCRNVVAFTVHAGGEMWIWTASGKPAAPGSPKGTLGSWCHPGGSHMRFPWGFVERCASAGQDPLASGSDPRNNSGLVAWVCVRDGAPGMVPVAVVATSANNLGGLGRQAVTIAGGIAPNWLGAGFGGPALPNIPNALAGHLAARPPGVHTSAAAGRAACRQAIVANLTQAIIATALGVSAGGGNAANQARLAFAAESAGGAAVAQGGTIMDIATAVGGAVLLANANGLANGVDFAALGAAAVVGPGFLLAPLLAPLLAARAVTNGALDPVEAMASDPQITAIPSGRDAVLASARAVDLNALAPSRPLQPGLTIAAEVALELKLDTPGIVSTITAPTLPPTLQGEGPFNDDERYVVITGDVNYRFVPSRRHPFVGPGGGGPFGAPLLHPLAAAPPQCVAITATHHGSNRTGASILSANHIPWAPGSFAAKAAHFLQIHITAGLSNAVSAIASAAQLAVPGLAIPNLRQLAFIAESISTSAHGNGDTLTQQARSIALGIAAQAANVGLLSPAQRNNILGTVRGTAAAAPFIQILHPAIAGVVGNATPMNDAAGCAEVVAVAGGPQLLRATMRTTAVAAAVAPRTSAWRAVAQLYRNAHPAYPQPVVAAVAAATAAERSLNAGAVLNANQCLAVATGAFRIMRNNAVGMIANLPAGAAIVLANARAAIPAAPGAANVQAALNAANAAPPLALGASAWTICVALNIDPTWVYEALALASVPNHPDARLAVAAVLGAFDAATTIEQARALARATQIAPNLRQLAAGPATALHSSNRIAFPYGVKVQRTAGPLNPPYRHPYRGGGGVGHPHWVAVEKYQDRGWFGRLNTTRFAPDSTQPVASPAGALAVGWEIAGGYQGPLRGAGEPHSVGRGCQGCGRLGSLREPTGINITEAHRAVAYGLGSAEAASIGFEAAECAAQVFPAAQAAVAARPLAGHIHAAFFAYRFTHTTVLPVAIATASGFTAARALLDLNAFVNTLDTIVGRFFNHLNNGNTPQASLNHAWNNTGNTPHIAVSLGAILGHHNAPNISNVVSNLIGLGNGPAAAAAGLVALAAITADGTLQPPTAIIVSAITFNLENSPHFNRAQAASLASILARISCGSSTPNADASATALAGQGFAGLAANALAIGNAPAAIAFAAALAFANLTGNATGDADIDAISAAAAAAAALHNLGVNPNGDIDTIANAFQAGASCEAEVDAARLAPNATPPAAAIAAAAHRVAHNLPNHPPPNIAHIEAACYSATAQVLGLPHAASDDAANALTGNLAPSNGHVARLGALGGLAHDTHAPAAAAAAAMDHLNLPPADAANALAAFLGAANVPNADNLANTAYNAVPLPAIAANALNAANAANATIESGAIVAAISTLPNVAALAPNLQAHVCAALATIFGVPAIAADAAASLMTVTTAGGSTQLADADAASSLDTAIAVGVSHGAAEALGLTPIPLVVAGGVYAIVARQFGNNNQANGAATGLHGAPIASAADYATARAPFAATDLSAVTVAAAALAITHAAIVGGRRGRAIRAVSRATGATVASSVASATALHGYAVDTATPTHACIGGGATPRAAAVVTCSLTDIQTGNPLRANYSWAVSAAANAVAYGTPSVDSAVAANHWAAGATPTARRAGDYTLELLATRSPSEAARIGAHRALYPAESAAAGAGITTTATTAAARDTAAAARDGLPSAQAVVAAFPAAECAAQVLPVAQAAVAARPLAGHIHAAFFAYRFTRATVLPVAIATASGFTAARALLDLNAFVNTLDTIVGRFFNHLNNGNTPQASLNHAWNNTGNTPHIAVSLGAILGHHNAPNISNVVSNLIGLGNGPAAAAAGLVALAAITADGTLQPPTAIIVSAITFNLENSPHFNRAQAASLASILARISCGSSTPNADASATALAGQGFAGLAANALAIGNAPAAIAFAAALAFANLTGNATGDADIDAISAAAAAAAALHNLGVNPNGDIDTIANAFQAGASCEAEVDAARLAPNATPPAAAIAAAAHRVAHNLPNHPPPNIAHIEAACYSATAQVLGLPHAASDDAANALTGNLAPSNGHVARLGALGGLAHDTHAPAAAAAAAMDHLNLPPADAANALAAFLGAANVPNADNLANTAYNAVPLPAIAANALNAANAANATIESGAIVAAISTLPNVAALAPNLQAHVCAAVGHEFQIPVAALDAAASQISPTTAAASVDAAMNGMNATIEASIAVAVAESSAVTLNLAPLPDLPDLVAHQVYGAIAAVLTTAAGGDGAASGLTGNPIAVGADAIATEVPAAATELSAVTCIAARFALDHLGVVGNPRAWASAALSRAAGAAAAAANASAAVIHGAPVLTATDVDRAINAGASPLASAVVACTMLELHANGVLADGIHRLSVAAAAAAVAVGLQPDDAAAAAEALDPGSQAKAALAGVYTQDALPLGGDDAAVSTAPVRALHPGDPAPVAAALAGAPPHEAAATTGGRRFNV